MLEIKPLSQTTQLKQPWKQCITVGRAYDLTRADLRAHLEQAQREIGWRYIRFHALFHDDMDVVRRDPETGNLRFQWHHVDKVFDYLLSIGLRPFVELNPMPAALASGDQRMFKYQMNVTPPSDWLEWEELVREFTRHCVRRYGLEEVRQWYFEVWNEPNLAGFWSGSQEDYWNLYRHAAHGVKAIDERLRVGGPATAGAGWIQEFIDDCASAKVPLDFVSTHRYPQDEYCLYPDRHGSPHAPGAFFKEEVQRVQDIVKASSMPDLEIHWTEWNSQSSLPGQKVTWSNNIHVDTAFAASFIAKHCLELDEACDSFAWWVVSDIFEEHDIPSAPFSCTYGLMTIHGLPKASYNAFRLLAKMKGMLMAGSTPGNLSGERGYRAVHEAGVTRILLWNHPPLEAATKSTWSDALRLPHPVTERTRIFTTTIAPGSGSAWEPWVEMGRPHHVEATELDVLATWSRPAQEVHRPADSHETGVLEVPFNIAPYTVHFLEIRDIDIPSWGKGVDNSNTQFNEQLNTGSLKKN